MDFELLVSEIEQACKDHGVTVLRAVPFHISHVPTFRVEDEVSPSKVIRAAKATTTIVYLDVLRLTKPDLEDAIARKPTASLEGLKSEVGKICAISLYLPSQSGFLTEWHKFAPWYFSVFEDRYRQEADDDEDELSAKEEELAARAARLLAMGKTKKMVAKLLGISLQDLERLL